MPRVTIWVIESDNDKEVVKCLSRKLATYLGLNIRVRAVGKKAFNDVAKQLKRKPDALERAIADYLEDSNCVIFVTDSDSYIRLEKRQDNPTSAISHIKQVQDKFAGKVHLALAVHELEAWLLVDCLGICCYFAGVENSPNPRQRQYKKFQSLLKQSPGNTELIVEVEPGAIGPKEYLIEFSGKILKTLNPKIKPRILNQKKYKPSLSPEIAQYIEINDDTLRRNNSLRQFGQYLEQCGAS